MGRFKQLLPFGGQTVVESVVQAVLDGGVDDVVVVLGHRADEVRQVLDPLGVTAVVNESYREGMFSSLLCGLGQIPGTDAILLALGDQPQISSTTVARVIQAFRTGNAGIVVPVYGGKRGHPIVFDLPRYRDEIVGLSGEEGLKPVVRGHPEDTLEITIDDERILRDLDTPEDYQRELADKRKNESEDAS